MPTTWERPAPVAGWLRVWDDRLLRAPSAAPDLEEQDNANGRGSVHRTLNGKPWTGKAATRGRHLQPATGKVSGTVDYGQSGAPAAVTAKAALPGWQETAR